MNILLDKIVELGDLEVTTRGVLRGNIVGSTVGASLSKKTSTGNWHISGDSILVEP